MKDIKSMIGKEMLSYDYPDGFVCGCLKLQCLPDTCMHIPSGLGKLRKPFKLQAKCPHYDSCSGRNFKVEVN